MLSYFNIRNLYNADIVRARKKHWKTALDGFRWFRTNVVSQLADRLKIRTNGITSELAEVSGAWRTRKIGFHDVRSRQSQDCGSPHGVEFSSFSKSHVNELIAKMS